MRRADRTVDTSSRQKIQQDFDWIAAITTDGWDHNSHYHRWLVSPLPGRCYAALYIDWGSTGEGRHGTSILSSEEAYRAFLNQQQSQLLENQMTGISNVLDSSYPACYNNIGSINICRNLFSRLIIISLQ